MNKLKKPIDIELLLQWTYCDELAKRKTAVTWDTITSYGERGGHAIDEGPTSPQRYAFVGEPHPDAIAVESMVAALDDVRADAIDWEESRAQLFGPALLVWAEAFIDWQKSRRRDDGVFVEIVRDTNPFVGAASFGLPQIVRRCATLRRRPDWERDTPAFEKWMPLSGCHPIVVAEDEQGRLCTTKQSGKQYRFGARVPLIWFPTPRQVAWARAEYALWWGALNALCESLNSGWLREHVATLPVASEQPWVTGDPSAPRVLKDMAAKPRLSLLAQARRRALGRAPVHRDPGRRLDSTPSP